MFATETTNAITPIGWLFRLYFFAQNETDSNLPSRLEFAFLLDSGACFLVLNIPTYMIITQIFNAYNHNQHGNSKPLTMAKLSEVPNESYIILFLIN